MSPPSFSSSIRREEFTFDLSARHFANGHRKIIREHHQMISSKSFLPFMHITKIANCFATSQTPNHRSLQPFHVACTLKTGLDENYQKPSERIRMRHVFFSSLSCVYCVVAELLITLLSYLVFSQTFFSKF